MARMKKLQLVREVKSDKTGEVSAIFLDPNRLDFVGNYGGVEFRDKDAHVVQQWLYDRMAEGRELVWIPVIAVYYNLSRNDAVRENGPQAHLSMVLDRFYLGSVPGSDVLIKSKWERKQLNFRSETERKADDALSDSDWRYKHSERFVGIKPEVDGTIKLPVHTKASQYGTTTVSYLAYTQPLYYGLATVVGQLEQLGKQLVNFTRSNEGRDLIENKGKDLIQFALPAGDDNEHTE